jgi:BsuBI/PstI restriction endonuclease
MSATEHVENALQILISLGLPRAQHNEGPLCLLALLHLSPEKKWVEAGNPYAARPCIRSFLPESRCTIP